MALVPANFSALIVSNTGWTGDQFSQMATGIAVGFTTYLVSLPTPIRSNDVGTVGSGAGNGFLLPPTCSPPLLQASLESALRGQNINGESISELTKGLSIATCTYLGTAQTLTTHAGVGVGTGIAGFSGLDSNGMGAAITSATGFTGTDWQRMVSGISSGLVTFLLSSVKFNIVISGPTGPSASTGTGVGKIF